MSCLSCIALLWPVVCGSATGFAGVEHAAVEVRDNVPRLMVNGKARVPFLFFFNPGQNPDYLERFQRPQVEQASRAGIHLYSYMLPPHEAGGGLGYERSDEVFRSFVEMDPEGLHILRLWPGPKPHWPEWADIPDDHIARYADGSQGKISIASPYYWELSNKRLAETIRHYESEPFGRHVIGYHIGGPDSENFAHMFREKGPDISGANQRRFRNWLTERYETDAALRAAWGDPDISLETASLPVAEPGRFPMHTVGSGAEIDVFYDIPGEQDWVDYSLYVSDLAAERIADWARLVKEVTEGCKLTVFFYGYTFELIGSFGAHGRLDALLENPDVDILVSPVSYNHRGPGDPGGFMAPVDSVITHGKLWINEEDLRTHVIREESIPAWLTDGMFNYPARDLHESLNLLDRNLAGVITHRAGTWWMDLAGGGAFDEPALWRLMEERKTLYEEVYADPEPYTPEVAVVAHERSKAHVKSDWAGFYWPLSDLRNQCARAGVAVGYYTLRDFVRGVAPPARVYVFPNAFALNDGESGQVKARLLAEGATAVWVYAPGGIGPDGIDPARASSLAGIDLARADGVQGSQGIDSLAGLSWGPTLDLSPRLHVVDGAATPLARYRSDGLVSAADKTFGGHRSVFFGDMGVSRDALRVIFQESGAHVWVDDGSVVHTDGRFLAIHTGDPGEKRIHVPQGLRLEPLDGDIAGREDTVYRVDFRHCETRWFRLLPDED